MARDPIRTLTTSCMIIVIAGVGALVVGLILCWWRHAVDVGVRADHELLDRLSRTSAQSAGSVSTASLESYANKSLRYHQALQKLYVSIASVFLVGGVGLVITGGLQLRALRALRRRVPSGGRESAAT